MSALWPLTHLTLAMGSFVLFHFLPGTRVREALVARMGRVPYFGAFSAVSFAQYAWIGLTYAATRMDGANLVFWQAYPATRIAQITIQAVAFLLIAPGLMMTPPSRLEDGRQVLKPTAVSGMRRITRHPFLAGAVIWALGHMLVNGDAASFILFGGILILSVVGMLRIDERRRRALGPAWKDFAEATSLVPFAAILQGRQSLRLGEIGIGRFSVAVIAWIGMFLAHPILIGVKVWP